jgi:signal transduction histidine kinase
VAGDADEGVVVAAGEALQDLVGQGADGAAVDEAVAPFEMALRGYQESNQRLQRQNEELREAHRATAAANRELEAFSGRAAHDLRSPLNVVDGFAQLLLDDDATVGGREREWVGEIRGAVGQMLTLVHELLQLSRASGADLVRERVDLTALVKTVVARLRTAWPGRKVDVDVKEGLVCRGDPRLLVIVLENLLGNAWKFTSRVEAARVVVGGDGNVFFVKDNGAGFDMAQKSRLFTPFQRLHSNADFEGTGIGLATVTRILQRHGGRIWADAAPGQGATFWFTTEPEPATTSFTAAATSTPKPG